METAIILHRLQFAFTIMFHYLFPQLTMGLAFLLVFFKSMALWKKNEAYNQTARFWAKIFAINFAIGVVTGIPMEFQFGTNWAAFSNYAGGVIGQTLAMEGVFAFFLESSFLGLFLFGEKRLSPKMHWFAALMVFLGSWTSGYFIITTNAWMQHPVAYAVATDGTVHLNSFWGLVLNPWIFWQYLHNMIATIVTASFVVAAVGAYYLLSDKFLAQAKIFIRTGVIAGGIASFLLAFPTGDGEAQQVFEHQPTKAAAMEGIFETVKGAPLVIIGQPDMKNKRLDNPFVIPNVLSFLTYRRFTAEVKGLNAFPEEDWPDNIPLLYYAYHMMVGLGTIFIAILFIAGFLLWRKKLFDARWMLWILLLAAPFPYIATTAGWMTAEIGRQPWLVYGLLRTAEGVSPLVSSGNTMFTLIGFVGMYFVMGLLFILLVLQTINKGPAPVALKSANGGL